jgi:hypothetical protein
MDARQLELVASGFPSTLAATDDLHAELAPAGSGVVQFEAVTKFLDDCPGRPGAFKRPSRFPSEIRGGFVWVWRALTSPKRRFPARAVADKLPLSLNLSSEVA